MSAQAKSMGIQGMISAIEIMPRHELICAAQAADLGLLDAVQMAGDSSSPLRGLAERVNPAWALGVPVHRKSGHEAQDGENQGGRTGNSDKDRDHAATGSDLLNPIYSDLGPKQAI